MKSTLLGNRVVSNHEGVERQVVEEALGTDDNLARGEGAGAEEDATVLQCSEEGEQRGGIDSSCEGREALPTCRPSS